MKKEASKNKAKGNDVISYMTCEFSGFIASFKAIGKTYPMQILYDLLFYVFAFFMLTFWADFMTKSAEKLGTIDTAAFQTLDQVYLEQMLQSMQSYLIVLLASLFLLLVGIVLLWAVFKGMVWLTILRKKPALRFFRNYSIVTFLWFVLITLLIIIVSLFFREGIIAFVMLALLFLIAHMSSVIAVMFTHDKGHRVMHSLKHSFRIGIMRIHRFVIPYILAAVIFIILNLLLFPLQLSQLGYNTVFGIWMIAALMYAAWLRIYIASVVSRIAGFK